MMVSLPKGLARHMPVSKTPSIAMNPEGALQVFGNRGAKLVCPREQDFNCPLRTIIWRSFCVWRRRLVGVCWHTI